MNVPVRKKLIEVALPLAAINEASAKEKSIRHGHPSTLHLWWARRPLAACRAVLFAQFVDDPSSVPEEFPDEAAQEAERKRLFGIIERLVVWKNSNDEHVLRDARREIAYSVARSREETPPTDGEIDDYIAVNAPPVVDPFCGGGSIPLEAQRLGLRTYGSDLNPVAVLITKALVELPTRFGGRPPVSPGSIDSLGGETWAGRGASGLAADVRYYGEWMRDEAAKRIGHFYPQVEVTPEMTLARPDLKPYGGRRLTVIAWLWARTVASPNPAAKGAHVPLVSSFMLSTKRDRKSWVELVTDTRDESRWRFEARSGSLDRDAEAVAKLGTKAGRAKDFVCCLTGAPIRRTYVQAEGKARRLGKRLMAIVATGRQGRVYLTPTAGHEAVAAAEQFRPQVAEARSTFLSGSTPTRAMITGGVCSAYGLSTWGDLYTDRQVLALTTFADLVGEARALVKRDYATTRTAQPDDDVPLADGGTGARAYADAVAVYLGLSVSRQANRCSSLNFWDPGGAKVQQVFARQALPMVWDFCEANPFSSSSGNFVGQIGYLANVVEASPSGVATSRVNQVDSTSEPQVWTRQCVFATDPPYYDNIGYADLSDFFYIWLRRALRRTLPSTFRTLATPKSAELVATPHRFGGSKRDAQRFFESGFRNMMALLRPQQDSSFPLTLYYAFKQAETTYSSVDGSIATVSTGWDTMLTGVIDCGYTVEGTWPVRTELPGALKKRVAALASSIVLVCRRRSEDATASRREFITALRTELPTAIRRLQNENVAPVDLAQAAIGPGMAVFSRYSRVLEADGSRMPVRRALVEINRVLDETLTDAEGDMDADTRFCVSWFEQYGMDERSYGEAEVLFTAKATSFEGVHRSGVLVGGRGRVRLKRRDELAVDWDPASDNRVVDWECVQHLVRVMTTESGRGVHEAARLATAMGPARTERARSLAYRLHAVSERKGWAGEALAYNVLATSWPQIQSAIAELRQGEQTQLPV